MGNLAARSSGVCKAVLLGWAMTDDSDDPDDQIQEIMAEAHKLISNRLRARGLEAVHVVFAVTNAGTGIVRTNAGLEVLKEMAETLGEIGGQIQLPVPGEASH